MGSGKPKQFARPPKKQRPKTSAPETADEFQEAADFEESAGGKHRVGDPVKSGRAFLRALDVYDKGLQKHPGSFDLAYNKARLQLEISQQPVLVGHIGVSLLEWLQLTVTSHRYALRLSEDSADALFNTAQALSSLAELLLQDNRSSEGIPLLHEALELLSSCLSRQEMMLEQHQLDFPDTEDGGVSLTPSEQPATPSDADMSEQSVTIETPVTPHDLLDTIHASLSALTTLAPLVGPTETQTLGDMAHSITETKAPSYLSLLSPEDQPDARFSIAVDRANFVAAFANTQYEHHMIELETYIARLDAFDIPSKEEHADALCFEAEARREMVLAAVDRFDDSPAFPATVCWKQLSSAQDLYSTASKLATTEAQDRMAEIYACKGDLELLRHRTASTSNTDLSSGIRSSAQTLVRNAQKFYKGAVQYAKRAGDDELHSRATDRCRLAAYIEASMYQGTPSSADVVPVLESCVEEGLVSQSLSQALFGQTFASQS